MKKLTAVAVAALATVLPLSACGTGATTEPAMTEPVTSEAPMASEEPMASEAPMESSEPAESEPAEAMETGEAMAAEPAGAYLDYDEYQASKADFADHAVVLFFHAGWCPNCQAADASLTQDGVPDGLAVVKVDYDTADELKRTYGITYQHTFVQVDADGEELAKWTGSRTGEDILAETT